MKVNNKGMTLIEITVVLLISSILMLIAGGMILNGMGFFNKTASSDTSKLAVDKISELVRDELLYSTNVRIQVDKPDETQEWHSFSIEEKGGKAYLYQDGELLFNEDFYNHSSLQLKARVYENTYRMDLHFAFLKNEETTYQTNTTLELVNIKETKVSADQAEDATKSGSSSLIDIDATTKNKIWYLKDLLSVTDDPDSKPEEGETPGTVLDEITCKTDDNTLEWTTGGGSVKFPEGTFVEYPTGSGTWYRAITDITNSSSPEKNNKGEWKVISRTWQANSGYEKGDVVEYPEKSGNFYQKQVEYDGDHIGTKYAPYNTKIWKSIAKADIPSISCKVIVSNSKKTVAGEYERCGNGSEIKEWKVGISLKPGDFLTYNGKTYRFIYNIALDWSNLQVAQPGKWGVYYYKQIDEAYDERSRYYLGDIVFYKDEYYKVKAAYVDPGNFPVETWWGWEKIDIETAEPPNCRFSW